MTTMMTSSSSSSSSFPRLDASPSSHPRVVAHSTQHHVTSSSSSPCPHTRAYERYTYHKNGLTFTVANGVVVPVALPGCALIACYYHDDVCVCACVSSSFVCLFVLSFVRSFVRRGVTSCVV